MTRPATWGKAPAAGDIRSAMGQCRIGKVPETMSWMSPTAAS